MKKSRLTQFVALLSVLIAFTSWAQRGEDPLSFDYQVKKLGANLYEVRIVARIDEPWHIYSQFTPAEGPSLPTHIAFSRNPLVELVGKPAEKGTLITKYEEILDVKLQYFNKQVEFVQKIKLKGKVKTNLNGSIDYMACTDERCLPPTSEKFELNIQ